MISLCLEKWRDNKTLGLSTQTFDALFKTKRAIADLSSELLCESYDYVLTGRLKTDPLERRNSQYRQMRGGRSLVSLTPLHPLLHPLQIINFVNKRFLQIY